MKTKFGAITQPRISKILAKQYKNVIIINVLWDNKNPKKVFKVLSCFIYEIFSNYVCIDYWASEFFKSELPVGSVGVYKHEENVMTKYLEL